jgi:hypothetical protein
MALRLSRIPTIFETPQDLSNAAQLVNERIEEINRVLAEVEKELTEMKGDDDNEPSFNADIDMNRKRVTNVERSKDPRDVVTRIELLEIGILGSPTGEIRLSRPTVFESGASVEGSGVGANSVATTDSVLDTITTTLGAEVASSVDGEQVSLERATGVNGITSGTLLMGVDGGGKARMLRVTDAGLRFYDPNSTALLTLILDTLQKIEVKLNGD